MQRGRGHSGHKSCDVKEKFDTKYGGPKSHETVPLIIIFLGEKSDSDGTSSGYCKKVKIKINKHNTKYSSRRN